MKCLGSLDGVFSLPAMLCLVAVLFAGAKSALAQVGGVSLSVASIIGGGTASGTVTLSVVAPDPGVVVTLSSDSTAASPTLSSVTVPTGQNSATFSVNTSSVSTSTVANITATGSDGSNSSAALSVLPQPTMVSVTLSPNVVVGGNSTSSNTVTLSSPAPTGGLAVNLSGNQPAAATIPASVTVAEGATVSAQFLITTSAVTSRTAVTVTATCSGSKATGTVTVTLPAVNAYNLSSSTVSGGFPLPNNTITLNGPAPTGDVAILLSSNSALAQPPTSVTIPAGQTVSPPFTINTSSVGISTTVSLTAKYNGGAKTVKLAIEPMGSFIATPLIDFQPGQLYLGAYPGNLYDSSNTPPSDHDSVGLSSGATIQPLDINGNPDPNGKIVFISVGPSSTTSEWCAGAPTHCAGFSFIGQAALNSGINHTTLAIVDGAHEGGSAFAFTCPYSSVCGSNQYNRIRDTVLTPVGLTEAQVQAVWVNAENGSATVSLPQSNADAYGLESNYGSLVRAIMQRWPNVKQVFFSSQIYTGFATTHLDPEPYAYESGFAVKWAVEAQIVQRRTGTIDPIAGDLITNAPFIAWGPYLWGADSQNPPGSQAITWLKSDTNADGTHPNKYGVTKVVGALMGFFLNSPYTPWFR